MLIQGHAYVTADSAGGMIALQGLIPANIDETLCYQPQILVEKP